MSLRKINYFSETSCLNATTAAIVFIAVYAIMAGFFSHSVALVLEGVLCTIDVLTAFATLYILKLINEPSSDRYQFGYFKLEPLVIVVETSMLVASCFISVLHSIKDLIHHTSFITNYGWGFGYTIFSFILGAFICVYVFACHRKKPTDLLQLEYVNWKFGLYLSLGLLVGFLIAHSLDLSKDPILRKLSSYVDPIMTITIVFFIILEPAKLLIANSSELLDKRPTQNISNQAIFTIVNRYADQLQIDAAAESFKLRKSGRVFFSTLTYNIDSKTTLEKMQALHSLIEQALKDEFKNLNVDIVPIIIDSTTNGTAKPFAPLVNQTA